MKKELIMPKHVGIIMDGNGRWATNRNLSRSEGHRAGANNLKKIVKYAGNLGIKYLSLYAFSTENFKRSKTEVDFLMNLFVELFKKEMKEIIKNNIRIIFSGREEPLPKKVLKAMVEIEEKSKENNGLIVNICLNYGGRAEIVDMTKKLIEKVQNKELKIEEITEELILKNLYKDLPDVDFLIRTSGELRLSNFLPYQTTYSELYFPKTYFPDFNEIEFEKALQEFHKRNRRFGGV